MSRTVFVYPKKKYQPTEIDALEYAKRYGEHMLAVKIQKYRAGTAKKDVFIQDLMALIEHNGDALINTRTE